jgi:large subunit ribosomal protein L32
MALPKKKYPKSHKGKRRSHHALNAPQLTLCPQCNSPKLPHHVCPTCGSYAGREVVSIKSPKKKNQ